MNNLFYMLLLSGVLGRHEIDPMLLCLLCGLPGMGTATGGLGVCPTAPPPLPCPPLPPPPTTTTTPQTSCCTGMDPILMCLLFSGGLFGEGRRGRKFPPPFHSEPLEKREKS
jgi:hypothetical protein